MRRTTWFRSLASLLALWFPLVIGEPGLLQPCPMHGAGHAMSAMMMHHGGSSGASAMANSHQGPGESHGPHHCTCIDCCGIGLAAALRPTEPLVAVVVAESRGHAAIESIESLPRPAPEHSRPYTTGPPRA